MATAKKKAEATGNEWTTMYVPKGSVQELIIELQELVEAEVPYDITLPKYKVLELALNEAIAKRTKKRR